MVVVLKVVASARVEGGIEPRLMVPAVWLTALVAAQILLGAGIIWLQRAPIPTSFHVVNGAAVLMLAFILAVRGSRFGSLQQTTPTGPAPASI